MTFQTQAQQAGGEIVRIVELVLPRCVLRYGNAPCTAGARSASHPNLIQQSEVFSGGSPAWGWNQTPVFSSFIAPNSTLTGILLVDSHNAANFGNTAFVNSNDPAFASVPESAWLDLSVHVLKKPSQQPTLYMRALMFDGVGSADFRMGLDAFTGCWSARHAGTLYIPVQEAKVVDCGSWWRIHMTWNRASCNSISIVLYPAAKAAGNLAVTAFDASQVGSHGVWGLQLRPTSSSMQFQPYITRGVESQWIDTGLAGACYQTAHTCAALSSYLQGEQSVFFIDENVDLPRGLSAYPALVRAQLTPARLNPQAGVGDSARLSLELRDFPDGDRGTDPYVDARSYNPNSSGTFFGKLFARDPYVHGKKLRYWEGYYAGSGTFTFSHYLVREFIVDEIDRPDYKGRVKIRGTDILRLTNGDRALCPLPSTATLQGNLTAVDTVVYLPSSAAAAYLAGDPHVRIDDEVIRLVTQTGCSWTTTRASGKSAAAVHSAGSVVQVCKTYSYMNVCSIAMDQLVNFAAIPSSYIPVNSWDAEKAATLTTYNLYNIISVPTPVRDNLNEITSTCDISMWFEEVAAKIALKHQQPWATPGLTLSDSASFVDNTMTIKGRDDLKVSRVGVRYAPTDYTGTDFGRFQMAVNSMREDVKFDGRKSEHTIETKWLSDSHDSLAATIAGRAMLRYSDLQPLEAQFQVDATLVASVRTGDVVSLVTRMVQGVDGSPQATRMQVIEHGPEMAGHNYRVNALLYQGLSAASSLSIDVSTYNYNVHSALGGPATAVRVYLTVGSGISVGGSGAGQAAITTSGLPTGSIVYLTGIGSSMILGYCGSAGLGGQSDLTFDPVERTYSITVSRYPEPGVQGGAALYVADGVTAYIDVGASYLFGGGGGGGGGGIQWFGPTYPSKTDGSAGGSGQGFTNSGGPQTGGTGGLDGGTGGVWGAPGTAGEDGNIGGIPGGVDEDGGEGGLAGHAVKLASANAAYFFINGYDSTHVKGLVGL